MNKSHEAMSNALGIEHELPVVTAKQEIIEPTPISDAPDQEEDYRLSRKTFRDLINKGNDAIEDLTDLAKQSESPRAYEVLATLMKTVSEATKDLYDLQKKTKDLKGEGKKNEQTNVNVEKAVFVGSPSQLLAQMKETKTIE